MRTQRIAILVAMGVATAMLAGCRVEKTTHGDGKEVNISTPFGGMHVKTNGADMAASIGLPGYPGAQAVNDDHDDHRSADVDMSFGSFQLRVKTAKFRTDDSPDKVEAFYRDGLKRFGDVIACRDNRVVGNPARTSDGLTCDSQKHHVTVNDHTGKGHLELKAGSEQHQHIVEIESDGGGTKFSLVALDLPGKMTMDDEDGKGTE